MQFVKEQTNSKRIAKQRQKVQQKDRALIEKVPRSQPKSIEQTGNAAKDKESVDDNLKNIDSES